MTHYRISRENAQLTRGSIDHKDRTAYRRHGTGEVLTIRQLAAMIGEVTGYRGEIQFDSSKPNGTPRKVLDVSKLSKVGWRAKIALREGVEKTYAWYLHHCSELQAASAGARKQ